MTAAQLDGFLNVVTWVCVAGAILNLLLIPRRKLNAILLALAFTVLGVTVYGYRNSFPELAHVAGTVVVMGLLLADFLIRAGRPARRRTGKGASASQSGGDR